MQKFGSKPPRGYPEATLRLPVGSREGLVQGRWTRGLKGRLEVVTPRTNPPKRGRSPRTQTVTPSTKWRVTLQYPRPNRVGLRPSESVCICVHLWFCAALRLRRSAPAIPPG